MNDPQWKALRGMALIIILGIAAATLFPGCLSHGDSTSIFVYPGAGEVATQPVVIASPSVMVRGYVAINRYGETVDGSAGLINLRVETAGVVVTTSVTNERGHFELALPAGKNYDIYASRAGLALTKVQNLYVDRDYPPDELMIVIQKAGPEFYASASAPSLIVRGVRNFQRLGEATTDISLESNKNIYQYCVGMNNSYFVPVIDLAAFKEANTEVRLGSLKLAPSPGGKPQSLTVFVTDQSNNMTMEFFYLLMPDPVGTLIPSPPASITVQALTIQPTSTKWFIGDVAASSRDYLGKEAIVHVISWGGPADGGKPIAYNMYRSFDGASYTFLNTVSATNYVDINPALKVGRRTWYKITSVGQAGESQGGISVWTEPLPVFAITLNEPVGENVSIDPLIRWTSSDLSGISGLKFTYEFLFRRATLNGEFDTEPLYGLASATVTGDNMLNEIQYSTAFGARRLVRGEAYSWQMKSAVAVKTYIVEKERRSSAQTFGASENFMTVPINTALEFRTSK